MVARARARARFANRQLTIARRWMDGHWENTFALLDRLSIYGKVWLSIVGED